ncbi:MAG TPA: hypothetical protein VNV60_03665 [Holophagaceae bacterium]|nr:hypothetical protein [Holophagaceae bacterium]
MAFITLKTPALSGEQKKRLGDRILYALQQEGIAPGTVVLRYEIENADLYMDGSLVESPRPAPVAVQAPVFSLAATRITEEPAEREEPHHADYKTKARRNKKELEGIKDKLVDLLKRDGSLSSFDAQKKLKLDDCDWAPNTLRRLFSELIESGEVRKEGEKRGTRYHWAAKGKEDLPPAKLVKSEHPE